MIWLSYLLVCQTHLLQLEAFVAWHSQSALQWPPCTHLWISQPCGSCWYDGTGSEQHGGFSSLIWMCSDTTSPQLNFALWFLHDWKWISWVVTVVAYECNICLNFAWGYNPNFTWKRFTKLIWCSYSFQEVTVMQSRHKNKSFR